MNKVQALFLTISSVCINQFLYSCNSFNQQDQNKNTVYELDTLSIKNELLGVRWCGYNNEPAFEIFQDSIYFILQKKSHPYKLNGKEFSIKFSDRDTFAVWGEVILFSDTLFFKSDDGSVLKAIKCK